MKTVNVMVMVQMDIPNEGDELINVQTALDFINNGLARDCDENYNTQLFVNSVGKSDITYPNQLELQDTKSLYECIIEYLDDKYTLYYEIHVFFSRNDGYSVPISINAKDIENFDDDSIINFAITFDKLNNDDAIMVDRVEEIDYDEYIAMGGK